jgi:hypothetical protein
MWLSVDEIGDGMERDTASKPLKRYLEDLEAVSK